MRDLFSDPGTAKPLRPHQERALAMLKASLAGKAHMRPVLQLATGAGKTRIAAEIINGALAKGNRVAFTVPALSLIDQTVRAFEDEGITRINVMQGQHPRRDPYARVHVVSVQTLGRRDRPAVDLVVVDECHRRFEPVSKWMLDCPDLRFIGLSATPWAKGMADQWDDLIIPVGMQQLIDAGFLSPFRVFAPSHPDLSTVRTVRGDYDEGQLSAVMSENRLVADVVATWKRLAQGLPTLVFAVDRAHAETLQRQFAASGVAMGYCDAHTDRVAREMLFRQMAAGEIAGIGNVGTLTTGVDADVRCVVMARPTKSEMLFVQCIGRGLRTAPGKSECIIIDHADNHARLGFVTDIHHDRLLTGAEKPAAPRSERGEKTPKECPKCGALRHGRECFACGFVAQRVSEIEPEAGELVEVKGRKARFTPEDKQRLWSALLAVAQQRGRTRGWASHAYREKTGVWPRGLSDEPLPPSPEVLGFVKHKDIAFAKRRAA